MIEVFSVAIDGFAIDLGKYTSLLPQEVGKIGSIQIASLRLPVVIVGQSCIHIDKKLLCQGF